MKCPACHGKKVSVMDSRRTGTGVWRRRVCDSCHNRWTTAEVPTEALNEAFKLLKKLKFAATYRSKQEDTE
jgi:transcriptional regulator NrdR family protein